MPKRTILSYAVDGRESYTRALPRLAASLAIRATGIDAIMAAPQLGELITSHPNLAHNPEFATVPTHQAVPYGFKPAIFEIARGRGYESALWCDSTITFQGDPAPIFELAERDGVCVFDNPGCTEAIWTSDDALEKMGCPIERARGFNQIMACALALSLTHPVGLAILDEWTALARDGVAFAGRSRSSRPEFRDHRHDQSCLSWLVTKRDIPYVSYGMLCYYGDRKKFPECLLTNQGVTEV